MSRKRCRLCDGLVESKGLCGKHRKRYEKYGDPNVVWRRPYCLIGEERIEKGQSSGRPVVVVKTGKGWQRKARAVFEKVYGVELRTGDCIFHLNNDQMDFRPENLVLRGGARRLVVCTTCGRYFPRAARAIRMRNFCPLCTERVPGVPKGKLKSQKVRVACSECGVIFMVFPCLVKYKKERGGRFICSRCARKSKKVWLICSRCGKVFWRWPSALPEGEAFCSRHCQRLPDVLIRKIKEVHQRYGWTYSRIACELGVSRNRVQSVMEGKLVPFSGGPNDVESAEVAEVG